MSRRGRQFGSAAPLPGVEQKSLFTGIIIDVGVLTEVRGAAHGATLTIKPSKPLEAKVSDSVAINGVCLTVTSVTGGVLSFDTVAETLNRSTLGSAKPGDRVNLELALGATERLGGHFVQGHVDSIGTISALTAEPAGRVVRVSADADTLRLIVEKGSIAIDGISLTVASVDATGFTVSIIPFTWEATNLADRRVGDRVNLETDILARYILRLLPEPRAGLSEKSLRSAGF